MISTAKEMPTPTKLPTIKPKKKGRAALYKRTPPNRMIIHLAAQAMNTENAESRIGSVEAMVNPIG